MSSSYGRIFGVFGRGGKGGGGGHTPEEDPDSLRSRDSVRVLDLVSEGPIEGLVNGMQSIYFDDVPLQNPDKTSNFGGVSVEFRDGSWGQEYIPGFPAVENQTEVNVELHAYADISRELSDDNVNAVRVNVSVPGLTSTDKDDGDVHGNSVSVDILLTPSGKPQVLAKTLTIAGKTTSEYGKSVRIELPPGGFPYILTLKRTTADASSVRQSCRTFFKAYTEIIDAKLRYPGSSIFGIKVDAAHFQNVPRRGYHLRGLKIQVPENYDPKTREYSGVWDGAGFKTAYTNNPAWILYAILTNKRYGLGNYIESSAVDVWGLYSIARYCDELVDDGAGGKEPRFTCNAYYQTQADAYQVVSDLTAVFRGVAIAAGSEVIFNQDRPGDVSALFTNANVGGGHFSYSGQSAKSRHSTVMVQWIDLHDSCRAKVECVKDDNLIKKIGVEETKIAAFGCTSRGQARRAGRWLLLTEAKESESVSFLAGADGAWLNVGDLVSIADEFRAGIKKGGRVVSVENGGMCLVLDGRLE